jgi:hypothetical protein
MTVKELRRELDQYDDNLIVMIEQGETDWYMVAYCVREKEVILNDDMDEGEDIVETRIVIDYC